MLWCPVCVVVDEMMRPTDLRGAKGEEEEGHGGVDRAGLSPGIRVVSGQVTSPTKKDHHHTADSHHHAH